MSIAQLLLIPYRGVEPDLTRFVLCILLMYAIGYPVGHTAVLGAFSKLQRQGRQAALMGWFASAGSCARIVFPVMASLLDSKLDNTPYSIILVLLSLSAIGLIAGRRWIDYFTGVSTGASPANAGLLSSTEEGDPVEEDFATNKQEQRKATATASVGGGEEAGMLVVLTNWVRVSTLANKVMLLGYSSLLILGIYSLFLTF